MRWPTGRRSPIDDVDHGDALDWELFTSKIRRQAPNWAPRTDETYHSVTYGFIVGEIVRRIDGRPIQQFIREELAQPLGADFIMGCGDDELARVAPQIPNPDNELMTGGLVNERTIPMFRPMPADPNYRTSPDYLRMVNPSGGGVSHALGLARLFAPLANDGVANGIQILDPATIAAACTEHWHHPDSMFGNDFRVALGFSTFRSTIGAATATSGAPVPAATRCSPTRTIA